MAPVEVAFVLLGFLACGLVFAGYRFFKGENKQAAAPHEGNGGGGGTHGQIDRFSSPHSVGSASF